MVGRAPIALKVSIHIVFGGTRTVMPAMSSGLLHRLVGDQVALAEEAVGHDQLEAGGLELLLDALVPVGGEQLGVVVRVLDQVRAVEHADVGHEVGEVAGVGDVHHVGALADHLVDLLARAELLAREDLDLRPCCWCAAATFLAKNSAARCAGSVVESECAKRIRITSWADGRRRAARRPATGRARAASWMSPGRLESAAATSAATLMVWLLEHVGELARLGGARIEDLQLASR